MEPVSGRMKLIFLFIIGSMLVMFIDGLFFDNYNSRPSMAMMHMEMSPAGAMYKDPHPPSKDEYFAQFQDYVDHKSDPNQPMVPEIIMEHGQQIKVFHLTANNILHEIRPGV